MPAMKGSQGLRHSTAAATAAMMPANLGFSGAKSPATTSTSGATIAASAAAGA
jgi:hypothetical protein